MIKGFSACRSDRDQDRSVSKRLLLRTLRAG